MQIGPCSVILSYTDRIQKQQLNQLSRRLYNKVLPAVAGSVKIDVPSHWDDWIKWGVDLSSNMLVRTGIKAKIGNLTGIYFGEWEKIDEEVMKPKGRGALKLNDSVVLGFTENGEWLVEK